MRSISGRVKLPELNRVIQAFAKESNAMELMSEMMEEALDTVGQTGELEDADEEQIINQVLDEIGVELQDNLVTSARKRNEEKEEEEEFDRQTLEKLKNLRAPQ
jgi:charged multivesicular body protein 2A